jgi:hypothetical protein
VRSHCLAPQTWSIWHDFTSTEEGLGKIHENDDLQISMSPALTFLERVLNGLRMSASERMSSEEAWIMNRLEEMLRDTPTLVHRRGVNPTNELDLQKIMFDYLNACFPSFRKNPPIGGALKVFVPDCGIASVGAAIEFKFVHTKSQMGVAFSGVAEDTAGYKGSKDWTRFYTVIYQTEPFMLESHLRHDLKRVGATTWTGIIVNGPSARKRTVPVSKTLKREKKNGRVRTQGKVSGTIRYPL